MNVEDCYIHRNSRHHDDRGFFQELIRDSEFMIAQVSYSRSKQGVVRGIHCSPYPKMVSCVRGMVFDVCVDLRPDSPTYLKWVGKVLSEESPDNLYIPANCGHGFCAVEDNSTLVYMQGGEWSPGIDRLYNPLDPKLRISWHWHLTPGQDPILSEQDRNAPYLEA